ncbi:MAG: glycogen/starch/alpha-glucan phosphorylase [Clostridiales bacterium]|nr:glycogen/starch/alpha-glucan phosphorylase [Clostridiales bacterium]
MNARELIATAEKILLARHRIPLAEAGATELHGALSEAAMLEIAPTWAQNEIGRAGGRRACYLSAEYLVGRLMFNNLLALGVLEEVRALLSERGVDLNRLEDIEDAALGNGGLGRLAACFLDSAATKGIPLDGYGLRYRFGLFKQLIEGGRQVEVPDDWAKWGDPWSVRRDEFAVTVPMRTGSVRAVPYDMPVIGLGGKNVGTLRLWQAESEDEFNFPLFNQQQYARASAAKNRAEDITKVLYPNDTKTAGKRMRIRQQYMLVSASLQDMLRQFDLLNLPISDFPEMVAAQLNDTHPSMAIPELIRLLGGRGVDFSAALGVARRVFSYTNHTVMQEALERWDISVLASVVPEIARIIREIDAAFRRELAEKGVGAAGLAIVEDGKVHMARLSAYATNRVNGVAEIHSELLKETVLRRFHELYPDRFTNVTNGVTQRRWLMLCNPELSRLIESRIGGGFATDLPALAKLAPHLGGMVDEFIAVKREKKRQFAEYVLRHGGAALNPDFLFDVQIKRLHEYKRQLLNALSIYDLYREWKDGRLPEFTPTAFLFSAKAAPGYARAKAIIYFINRLAELIRSDPAASAVMQVLFLPNYNCSLAEKIIPAADLSEQISPAGTEASGTGNMKLMLNGAPTIGTLDGANVEIVREAGIENNFIFGATVGELAALSDYDPRAIYESEPRVRRAVDALLLFDDPDGALKELHTSLLDGASWHKPDHYFVLKDFMPYQDARLRAMEAYKDRRFFAMMCLKNIAGAGKFSSDRSVEEYAKNIWRV